MNWLKKIWGKEKKKSKPEDVIRIENENQFVREFISLNNDERLKRIMLSGDPSNPDHFALFQYAILHDPDMHVIFAALKRIHIFKGYPGFESLLRQLQENGDGDKMEPYFSMALSRVGLITMEELEKKINSGQNNR